MYNTVEMIVYSYYIISYLFKNIKPMIWSIGLVWAFFGFMNENDLLH